MMSVPPSIDAYDAQMLDFSSDPDVPMHVTGSAEFFAEALMDHDGHLVASAFSEHAGVEVDMEEYVGDNAEYEMTDETAAYHRPLGDELLDIEVYDASRVASPLVPPQHLQPSTDVPIDSEHSEAAASAFSEHTTLSEAQGKPQPEAHPTPLDHPAADIPPVEPSVSGESVVLEVTVSESTRLPDNPGESVPPVSESHKQQGDATGQELEALASGDVENETELDISFVAGEHAANAEVALEANQEPPAIESIPPSEEIHTTGALVQVADETTAEEEVAVDPLHISDGVYIDPPPTVLLSIDNLTDPEFALFNLPEESTNDPKPRLPLLESRPTLYYEPLSSVFEALRQDENLLSRVSHNYEGELVLDAYELQLAVSEDNVHSREISLHDLNILHDGSDLVGPLRLLLRAVIPRFIIRYYALQEQIHNLHLTAELGGAGHEEEHQEHYPAEGQSFSQPEELVSHPSTDTAVVPKGLEAPLATEIDGYAKESALLESTEETSQENYELEGTSSTQEPSAEYHEVTGEVTHTLEDENDYEGTNVGNEDEATESESQDADQVNDAATEDTDTAATVTGQESGFGGEQNEYQDDVQAEEYDERYGEDLPERIGDASLAQYDEPPHYEEEKEQDISTAVDETQVALPVSDEDEERDESLATPVPRHVDLEPESDEHIDSNASDKTVPSDLEKSALHEEFELGTSETTNQADHAQTSNDQESNVIQARVFSEIDESDSNFVTMLEREAETEFERSFDAEHNGQESNVEASLQQIETWDEDEWDDEDAEGVDEEDWIDPDADSNESSVTLSSKASSKRSYDEVDPGEELQEEDPQSSPGSKRPRVQ